MAYIIYFKGYKYVEKYQFTEILNTGQWGKELGLVSKSYSIDVFESTVL